jgi:hypothetical protein
MRDVTSSLTVARELVRLGRYAVLVVEQTSEAIATSCVTTFA